MGAFRDLMQEAHDKGVTDLAFYVNTPRLFADEESASWSATGIRAGGQPPVAAEGRTGEEALRRLVEKLGA